MLATFPGQPHSPPPARSQPKDMLGRYIFATHSTQPGAACHACSSEGLQIRYSACSQLKDLLGHENLYIASQAMQCFQIITGAARLSAPARHKPGHAALSGQHRCGLPLRTCMSQARPCSASRSTLVWPASPRLHVMLQAWQAVRCVPCPGRPPLGRQLFG